MHYHVELQLAVVAVISQINPRIGVRHANLPERRDVRSPRARVIANKIIGSGGLRIESLHFRARIRAGKFYAQDICGRTLHIPGAAGKHHLVGQHKKRTGWGVRKKLHARIHLPPVRFEVERHILKRRQSKSRV